VAALAFASSAFQSMATVACCASLTDQQAVQQRKHTDASRNPLARFIFHHHERKATKAMHLNTDDALNSGLTGEPRHGVRRTCNVATLAPATRQ